MSSDPKKIEVEGKTVEDAIKKSLAILGLSKDQVFIETLCEEEKGLFGMPGAKPAKVRVTVLDKK